MIFKRIGIGTLVWDSLSGFWNWNLPKLSVTKLRVAKKVRNDPKEGTKEVACDEETEEVEDGPATPVTHVNDFSY